MANWRTHRVVLSARKLARKIGLTRFLVSIRQKKEYEDRFSDAMRQIVRPGDIIWDVGANHGYYSKKFLDWMEGSGKVYSFEPSPGNQVKFRQNIGELKGIYLVDVALSNRIGNSQFMELPAQDTASHLLDSDIPDTKTGHKTTVQVTTGEAVVDEGRAEVPHVVKIDTEGHEWEVLEGMQNLLSNKHIECICVEVHFRILEERGLQQAPAAIVALLERQGFQLDWCDASHIIARRGR